MINLDQQQGFFSIIGDIMKKKIVCYVIGGSAMMYYGAKGATKDIDLVFESQADRQAITGLLKAEGFRERPAKFLYFNKKDIPLLLERQEFRVDLFCEKIVNFMFTASMKERTNAVYEYGNLIIKVVSPEDIILLKCATERAGDRLDAAELVKRAKIRWELIIEESLQQMKLIGEVVPLSLYDFLLELRDDFHSEIPSEVIKKIEDIAYRETKKAVKKGTHIKVEMANHRRN